jgi:hypothetical protein
MMGPGTNGLFKDEDGGKGGMTEYLGFGFTVEAAYE